MSTIDFHRLKVHILTTDAYLSGTLVVPRRGLGSSRPPRFLDVLNSPALFLKSPGEIASDAMVSLSNGARHSFHGEAPRSFQDLYLRLDAVLLGSDEMPPGPVGTGVGSASAGTPSRLEMVLHGGLKITGTVRGGSKAVLVPRGGHRFVAVTEVNYSTPLTPDEERNLSFAAVNTRAVESVIHLDV